MDNKTIISIMIITVTLLSFLYFIAFTNNGNNLTYHTHIRYKTNSENVETIRNYEQLEMVDKSGDYTTDSENSTKLPELNNTEVHDWTDILSCQRIRQQRLMKMCKKLNLTIQPLDKYNIRDPSAWINSMIVDGLHKVIAQTIAKTGCSSWKYILIKNTPNGDLIDKRKKIYMHGPRVLEKFGLRKLNTFDPEDIAEKLNNYYTFMTVRHPLVRLESAYISKFTKNNRQYEKGFGKRILNLYRDKEAEPNKDIFKTGKGVHFEEFIKYVIENPYGRRNGHWRPYTDGRKKCGLPVDYIAKLETATEDMNYIIKTRLSNKASPVNIRVKSATSEHQMAQKYMQLPCFSNLSNPVHYIQKLHKFYGNDMKLYGYSYEYDEKSGQVVATCEYYDEHGHCC